MGESDEDLSPSVGSPSAGWSMDLNHLGLTAGQQATENIESSHGRNSFSQESLCGYSTNIAHSSKANARVLFEVNTLQRFFFHTSQKKGAKGNRHVSYLLQACQLFVQAYPEVRGTIQQATGTTITSLFTTVISALKAK